MENLTLMEETDRKGKIGVRTYLDSKVYDVVKKGAKRRLLEGKEQIEDIRRSAVNIKINRVENGE